MFKIPDLSNFPILDEERRPLFFRVRGTVILQIWWQILLILVYTLVIVCLHNYVNFLHIEFPLAYAFVLGVVVGLLLVFRTLTAYERYWEGKCLFSKLTHHIRSLTRSIWVGVEEKDPQKEGEEGVVKILIGKLSAINLLIAFAFATKNYLREEYSYNEKELEYMIRHLPKFRKQFVTNEDEIPKKGTEKFTVQNESKLSEKEQSLKNGSRTTTFRRQTSMFSIQAHDYLVPTNIPIEISYALYSYCKNLRKKGLANNTNVALMYWSISVMIECLSGMERILRSPIPIAYSVHLHHCVYLYLLTCPYQIVDSLNWLTLPAMAVSSFALLGIMRIGREIENPFGYDDNDLPLDDFCEEIREEIEMIVGNPMPDIDSWILSQNNYPASPTSLLSADELMQGHLSQLRDYLTRGSEYAGKDFTGVTSFKKKDSPSPVIVVPRV